MEWLFSEVILYIVIGLIILLAVINFLGVFNWNEWVYWLIGAAFMIAALAGVFHQMGENEERRLAAAAEPPTATPIDAFAPDLHQHLAGEIAIVAPYSPADAIQFERDVAFGLKRRYWALPLIPTENGAASVVLIVSGKEDLSSEAFARWLETEGLGGEAAPLRGLEMRGGTERLRDDLEETLTEKGVELDDDALLIEPFLGPRAEALKPIDILENLVAGLLIGGTVFGYGFVRRWMKRRQISVG